MASTIIVGRLNVLPEARIREFVLAYPGHIHTTGWFLIPSVASTMSHTATPTCFFFFLFPIARCNRKKKPKGAEPLGTPYAATDLYSRGGGVCFGHAGRISQLYYSIA